LKAWRGFRDRDYLETVEGLMFTVVSNLHPRDKVVAYLKYVPSPAGRWGAGARRYGRAMPYYDVPSLLNTISFLEENYPHYVHWMEELGIKMSAVPLSYIKRHFKPEERLQEVLGGPRDELEGLAAELAALISDRAKVPTSSLGVTGSLLIGIHRPEFSDVDLVVYGRGSALKVRGAVKELLEEGRLERVSGAKLEELVERRMKVYHLSRQEALEVTRRRWNRGVFKGRDFSIHPVKVEGEVQGRFEDRLYRRLSMAEVEATVVDDSEALFMPATYRVADVKVLEGPKQAEGVEEVVSYEGLHVDLVHDGEGLRARGKLEEVVDRGGGRYLRILIGGPEAGGWDYLKPLT
jgi:predicted nucleotidyltransferase